MGTVYLGTILHNQGYDVHIYNENIMAEPLDPFDIEADAFCISALTVSANRAILLAHEIKRINPDSRVVVGGIHASLVPKDFMEFADQVVVGEAENIIVDVVEVSPQVSLVTHARIPVAVPHLTTRATLSSVHTQ